MRKSTFLKAVVKECENIKKYATEEEIGRLRITNLDTHDNTSCIYGQMTGDCYGERGGELISKCCTVSFDSSSFQRVFTMGVIYLLGAMKSKKAGDRTGHHSALESYIVSESAKNKEIYRFIKGKTDALILE